MSRFLNCGSQADYGWQWLGLSSVVQRHKPPSWSSAMLLTFTIVYLWPLTTWTLFTNVCHSCAMRQTII